ncbi:MAG: hypothetical protein QM730_29340 [Anaerolineales bacterium]
MPKPILLEVRLLTVDSPVDLLCPLKTRRTLRRVFYLTPSPTLPLQAGKGVPSPILGEG